MKNKSIFSIPEYEASAHCDIPCGIYDPTPAKIAAKSVARMVDQLLELPVPTDISDQHALLSYMQGVNRRVQVKEAHAETCKRELEILWSDFFKEEHLTKFPDLHDKFWKAIKLASKNKQGIEKENAQALLSAVDDIARMFYEVKGDPDRFASYAKVTDAL
jgi:nickel superoxide dismutase